MSNKIKPKLTYPLYSDNFTTEVELQNEIDNRILADSSLATAISSISTGSLSTALSSEISTRSSGYVSLSTALSSEMSSRTSGDVSLSTALSTEINSRTSGDASLSTRITSLSTALSSEISSTNSDVTSLSTAINNVSSSSSSSSITTDEVVLTSNVTMTNANQFYTAVTETLTSGKWLLTANIVTRRTTTTITKYMSRLLATNNSNSWITAQNMSQYPSGEHVTNMGLSAIINTNGTTTVALQCASYGSTSNLILAEPLSNGGNTAQMTYIRAIRLGSFENPNITTPINEIEFFSLGDTINTVITSNVPWYVSSQPDWITITPVLWTPNSFSTTHRISITADQNPEPLPRSGTIVLTSRLSTYSHNLEILQYNT